MRMRKAVITILLMLTIVSALWSHGSGVHNNQLISALYGINGWTEMKRMPDVTKVPYYLISDAAYVAIDYNGSSNGASRLSSINRNLEALGYNPLPEMEWESLGGGKHRAYNHQGLYAEYDDPVKNRRLEQGRRILFPVVEMALGLDSLRAEIVGNEIYSTHILGDLEEGSIGSIRQHGRLATISGVIDDLTANLEKLNIRDGLTYSQREGIRRAIADLQSVSDNFRSVDLSTPSEQRISAVGQAREQVDSIIQQMNRDIDVDFNFPQMRKINRLNTILSSPMVNVGGAMLVSGGMAILGQVLVNGVDNLDWGQVALYAGLGLGGSVLDYSAGRAANSIVGKLFKPSSLGTGLVAGTFAVIADSAFDIGANIYSFALGNQTGGQTIRNSAVKLTANGIAYATSLGINAGVSILSGLITSSITGTVAGSIVPGIGNVVGFLLTTGSYVFVNIIADDVISYFSLRDIKGTFRTGSTKVAQWIDDYYTELSV